MPCFKIEMAVDDRGAHPTLHRLIEEGGVAALAGQGFGGDVPLGRFIEDADAVLVEGGGPTLTSFLRAGLADEMALFIAPRLIGSVGATAVLDGTAVGRPDEAPRLEDLRRIPLGADLLVLGRVGVRCVHRTDRNRRGRGRDDTGERIHAPGGDIADLLR